VMNVWTAMAFVERSHQIICQCVQALEQDSPEWPLQRQPDPTA
jgi:hypothetical protein